MWRLRAAHSNPIAAYTSLRPLQCERGRVVLQKALLVVYRAYCRHDKASETTAKLRLIFIFFFYGQM